MIYLDNSATTPLTVGVRDAMCAAMDAFGNPSSLHSVGLTAAALVKDARKQVCTALGVLPYAQIDSSLPLGAGAPNGKRLFFTSCGSEADNLAIFGTLRAKKHRAVPKIIVTDSEHPAMLAPLRSLAQKGEIELSLIPTKGGVLDTKYLAAELTPNTVLVSIMLVNNETGAKYDVKSAFSLVKRLCPTALTHTDAVQGFGKLNINLDKLGAHMITVSGHKIGAPKGIGALLVANPILTAKQLVPLIYGGGQEGGMRSGTENVVGIVGFGKACEHLCEILPDFEKKMLALRTVFTDRLAMKLRDGYRINQAPDFAPHIISLTLHGCRSETVLRFLSERGICISNGSACSSHGKVNSVLEAYGLSRADADSTVRISMGEQNTSGDLIAAADALAAACLTLVKR